MPVNGSLGLTTREEGLWLAPNRSSAKRRCFCMNFLKADVVAKGSSCLSEGRKLGYDALASVRERHAYLSDRKDLRLSSEIAGRNVGPRSQNNCQRSLAGDREWIVTRPDGSMLWQGDIPRMSMQSARLEEDNLILFGHDGIAGPQPKDVRCR